MKKTVLVTGLALALPAMALAQTTAPATSPTAAQAPATSPAAPVSAVPAKVAPAATNESANTIAPGVTLAAKSLAVKPGHYVLDPAHGKITWTVSHLGFSTYAGMFGGVSAQLTLDPHDVTKISLTATVDTSTVDTLNAKLNAELVSDAWFDSKKFPTATFKSTKVTVTGPQTARVDGDLTLHGKTFPIVLSATFNNAGIDPVDKQYTVGFDAATIIRRSTYGVSQYVPLVGDNVSLRIEGEFKLQP